MTEQLLLTQPQAAAPFPFTIDDLDCWVIEKADGTIVKFKMPSYPRTYAVGAGSPATPHSPSQSLGAYCQHYPAKLPIFEVQGLALHIGDASGTRRDKGDFDLVIDGGDVLVLPKPWSPEVILEGDDELCELLVQHVRVDEAKAPVGPRVLQIDWWDRRAPRLHPQFWLDLAEQLVKDPRTTKVLTCCQGGHGRSGTALTALMMCLTDYSPLDAVTHLRAVHCPRAIESVEQHQYLNAIGAYLGRPENALESQTVADFKARFLTLTNPISAPYQARLRGETR